MQCGIHALVFCENVFMIAKRLKMKADSRIFTTFENQSVNASKLTTTTKIKFKTHGKY